MGCCFPLMVMLDTSSGCRCWSFVGRRGKKQVVSLAKSGCVYHKVIQHELLHALGFNHEQSRSDRDSHVRIIYQNIIKGEQDLLLPPHRIINQQNVFLASFPYYNILLCIFLILGRNSSSSRVECKLCCFIIVIVTNSSVTITIAIH